MIERDGRVIQHIWQIRSGNIRDEKPQELFKSNKEKICPECEYESLYQRKQISERTITDLILTRSRVRKAMTRYVGFHEFCVRCRKIYFPPDIQKYGKRQLYGDGFRSWVVYQRIALRMPYDSIL
jgi:hypothetical protein